MTGRCRGRRFRLSVLGAVLALILAACSTSVGGHASRGFFAPTSAARTPTAGGPSSGRRSSSNPPTTPSKSAAPTGSDPTQSSPSDPSDPGLMCPTVTHTAARLKYSCATGDMQRGSDDVWPVEFGQAVEANWQMNEGSGRWGPPDGLTLAQITGQLREQVLEADAYGPSPTVVTVSDTAATVAGRSAHILQSLFTINPTFTTEHDLKVRTETSWIVAIPIDASTVSVWFLTVPDEAAKLVPDPNALIKSIAVI